MTARWCVEADARQERGGVAMLAPDVESMWLCGDRSDGFSSGDSYGDGDGYGDGRGDGTSWGDGFGDGCGYGNGYGDGYGEGDYRAHGDDETVGPIWIDVRGKP